MNYKNYDYITINSKKVKQNSIFVSTDSNPNHIKEAINNGASLIISKEKLLNHKNQIISTRPLNNEYSLDLMGWENNN